MMITMTGIRASHVQQPVLKPASVKRPHWLLLCRRDVLRQPRTIRRHDVYGAGIVTYTDEADELHVVEEACPHRGASLADGSVRDGCVVCPYHGMAWGPRTSPDRAYDYAALQGLVWVDVAKDLCTQHFMPPYYPEFSSPAFRTFGYSRTLEDVNPLVLLEHVLEHPRARSDATPRLLHDGPDGLARYELDIPQGSASGRLRVDVAYHVPFTAGLRFVLDGRTVAVVMYSVLPASASRVSLHVHVARAQPSGDVPSQVTSMIDDAVARGDEAIVHSVDARQWSRNHVSPATDAVGTAYRDAMRRFFPEVVAYCTAG